MTTIYLVRHAQSRPLAHQPEPEWTLSPVGLQQAQGLVPVLGALGIRRVYSSPYRRCLATLGPFAAAHGIEITLHEGLRERTIARRWVPDFRDVWRRSWEDFSYALEGGESSWACRARIGAAVETIVGRHPGETIALGSHGNAIGLFLHYVDETFGLGHASALRTPEIIKVVHRSGGFAWEKTFSAGAEFERLATDFRLTPGIVA
ncbi:MAG TPA: histidine phosphatase family protein [Opitutaceae bacterium]|nr:histidine phosphatase family protein [Opitutaceae bacterium]